MNHPCNFCQCTEFILEEPDSVSIYYQYNTYVCIKCGNPTIIYNNGAFPIIELESTVKRNFEYYQYNICFSCGFSSTGEDCCKNQKKNIDIQNKTSFTFAKSALKEKGIY